jgi:arabinogalactan oligomer/maltooligosaccharide transport system substrate-binding protein
LKRLFLCLLVLLFSLAVSGCGRQVESWRNPPAPPTASPTVLVEVQPEPPAQPSPTPPAGLTTVTYWEDDTDEGAVTLDELASAFMKENPGIQIKRVYLSTEDLRQQYRLAVQQGNPPELVRGAGELAGPFGDLELVRPLEGIVSQSMLDRFFPGALAGAEVNGRLWGMPDNYGNHLMLIYNKQLVQTVPGDTASWVVQLKSLKDPARGQYGLVYDLKDPFWLLPWLGGFGGWLIDDAGHPTLATKAMVNALQFLQDLKMVHQVVPPDVNYDSAFQMFTSGKAAYIIDGAWNLDRYKGAGVDIGVTALPKVSSTGLFPTPLTLGKYWFVSKNAKGPQLDAALKFMEFMTSATAQETWVTETGRLPSDRVAAASEVITQDPIEAGAVAQLDKGRGLESIPEMYCAWGATRDPLSAVMDGTMTPEMASQAMQVAAEQCIAGMDSDGENAAKSQ